MIGETPEESHDDAQSVQDRINAALEREATPHIKRAVDALARAMVAGRRGDFLAYRKHYEAYLAALRRFAHLTSNGMVLADYVGRMQTVMEARLSGALLPAVNASLPKDLPDYLKMPMTEAVQALAARNPVLAPSGERVAAAYARGEFALARSTSLTVTRKVHGALIKHTALGGELKDFTATMKESGFSESYAETVYRTNMAQAMTAGRVDQATDPDLGGYVVAWRWQATMDMATRPTHAKMDGFVASLNSPVWKTWSCPGGFNCRCSIAPVTRPQAEAMGRLDAQGRFIDDPPRGVMPDKGFATGLSGGIYAGVSQSLGLKAG